MNTWQKLRTTVDVPFVAIGVLLTIYIGFAAFGFVKNSSEHYSNFILGVCLMAGLLAIRNLCDEKLGLQQTVSDAGVSIGRQTLLLAAFRSCAIRSMCHERDRHGLCPLERSSPGD